jgi:hypothetical protein
VHFGQFDSSPIHVPACEKNPSLLLRVRGSIGYPDEKTEVGASVSIIFYSFALSITSPTSTPFRSGVFSVNVLKQQSMLQKAFISPYIIKIY